jgi:hypothetical protein
MLLWKVCGFEEELNMMTMRWDLMSEIQAKVGELTPEEKLYLVERILGSIRKEHFTDNEALAASIEAMANDPDMQRVLRNEDLPYGGVETRAAG